MRIRFNPNPVLFAALAASFVLNTTACVRDNSKQKVKPATQSQVPNPTNGGQGGLESAATPSPAPSPLPETTPGPTPGPSPAPSPGPHPEASPAPTPGASPRPVDLAACRAGVPREPAYQPLQSSVSPDELLTTNDLEGTLKKLKRVASPTARYHRELVQVVESAPSMSPSHLTLLYKAVYFQAADRERVRLTLARPNALTFENCVARETAARDHRRMEELKGYSDEILRVGISKLPTPISLSSVSQLLQIIDPASRIAVDVANYLSANLDVASEQEVLQLMTFANERGAADSAAKLAFQWFAEFSDKSYATMMQTSQKLGRGAKDVFLYKAIGRFSSFTLEQVQAIAQEATSYTGQVAGRAFQKIDFFSHERMMQFLARLDLRFRLDFAAAAASLYPTIKGQQLLEVLNVTPGDRNKVIDAVNGRISDLDVATAVEIAGLLSGKARGPFILAAVDIVTDLTRENLEALADAAGGNVASDIVSRGEKRLNR